MSAINKYTIGNIDILGTPNIKQFTHYLCNSHEVKSGMLVAINAEKVITAAQNKELFNLMSDAEYKYADGISIVKAIHRKYNGVRLERIAGADLWESLMEQAGAQEIPVFLVGGKKEVLAKTEQKLKELWQVNIVGSQDGYFSMNDEPALYQRIAESGAKIVTVAMGSPKQELFMRDCRQYYNNALYMGVGGTYDVFTGYAKRAPKLWQKLGLEWLYRLLSQPTRFNRQKRLLKFIYLYYFNKL